MAKLEVTQELVRKHFTYNGKNLEWLVPTCPRIKVGQKFGHIASNGYIRGTFYYQSFLEHKLTAMQQKQSIWSMEDMTKFNFVEDTRALKLVRQFHSKRILRFLKGKQFREVENVTDLQRSKSIILSINDRIGK